MTHPSRHLIHRGTRTTLSTLGFAVFVQLRFRETTRPFGTIIVTTKDLEFGGNYTPAYCKLAELISQPLRVRPSVYSEPDYAVTLIITQACLVAQKMSV